MQAFPTVPWDWWPKARPLTRRKIPMGFLLGGKCYTEVSRKKYPKNKGGGKVLQNVENRELCVDFGVLFALDFVG